MAPIVWNTPGFAAGASVELSLTEKNRVIVEKFVDLFYRQKRVREAFETFVVEDYIQHNPIIAGILLHGICYDFFFVTGQIYVDKKSKPEIRAQAQGLLVLVTYGLGLGIGAQIVGRLRNAIIDIGGSSVLQQFQTFWLLPAIFAAVIMVLFAVAFNEKKGRE